MNCSLMLCENNGKKYIVLMRHNLDKTRYVYTPDLEFVHSFSNRIAPNCIKCYDIIDFRKEYTEEEWTDIFNQLMLKAQNEALRINPNDIWV